MTDTDTNNSGTNNSGTSETNLSETDIKDTNTAFYTTWKSLLEDLRDYASQHPDKVLFEKEADFPDYIYRMERPYDLPTTIMSASLSDTKGHPVLLVNASPRHALFKEVVLHPFESHTYRKLKYSPEKNALVEGKRVFTKDMLFTLADELFGSHA
ncbi:MAG: NADH-quinone oxidoreductase subunit 15 [Trueperaceae bacterium]